jgi:hypothetical protein
MVALKTERWQADMWYLILHRWVGDAEQAINSSLLGIEADWA